MKTFRVATAVAAALLFSAVAARAEAQSKSWTAAKAVLPGDLMVVGGGNISTIQKSTIYKAIVPALLQQERDAKEGLEMVKTSCGIDVETSIADVAVGVTSDEKALIVAHVSGIDEAKVTSCLQKIAEAEAKEKGNKAKKLTAKTSGKIVEYTMEGEKEKLYVAWLESSVLAITSDPTDKSLLEKMIGGKGAVAKSGDISKALGKVNTSAAIWFAVAKKTPMGDGKTKATMKIAYGALDLAAGVVSAEGNIVVSSSAEAKAFADQANAEMTKNSGQMPPDMQKIMKNVKITSSGDTVTIKCSLTEKELMGVIGLMMTQM